MILFNSIYNEIIKIALKPRSYLGLAAITVLVGVIQFALKADGMSIISFVTASFEQTLTFEGNVLIVWGMDVELDTSRFSMKD